MYNNERENRRLYVASFTDDVPTVAFGNLIPKRTVFSAPKEAMREVTVWYMRPAFLLTVSVLLFAMSIGTTSYTALRGQTSVAAPIATTPSLSAPAPEPFNFGIAVEGPTDYAYEEKKARLIEEDATFVELDLVSMQLHYFTEGAETDAEQIISKGAPNTWWQVPAGAYKVDQKKERRYSTFGNIYMPWSVSFGGNFYINGIPYYDDGEDVPPTYTGGGVRLSNDAAEKFFNLIELGTPVLVRERGFVSDDFLYTASVPNVHAKEYLVADIESSTILAASDITAAVPIASLTKLMTALVASEHINLEKDVVMKDNMAAHVITLIPRLQGSYRVSMYSLLQLLLIESSNEAAEVIAADMGRAEFIDRMNEKARELGMRDTTFTDPSGLDDGNVSSMEDLLRLMQYILQNRGFIFELTHSQHLDTAYSNGQFGELANFNTIDGVNFVAGKVGETAAAGQTSVSLHVVDVDGEDRLIAVILLGTDARTDDIVRLVTFIEEQF